MKTKLTVAKKTSLYGFLTAAALLFGYVEYLVPLNFIAPGVKLGVSNAIILLLIINSKYKSAILINVARILLSGFLFATPFSLIFSLSAGVVSTLAMVGFSRLKKIGIVGISVVGGTVHNAVQILVAYFTVGSGVVFYLPFLILMGVTAGVLVGILVWLLSKKLLSFNIF